MNLEVDVMEGDEFTKLGGSVYQYRGTKWRYVTMEYVGVWETSVKYANEKPLDLPTFTRYCEGCGLTVKQVKPEPAVETIKPPEWAVVTMDGVIVGCESKRARDALMAKYPHEKYKPVRIDWGAK